MDNQTTPSLAKLLTDTIEKTLGELHTAMPAEIVSFDKATGLASVQPSLQRKYKSGELVDLPQIVNVPVMFPRGGGAVITFDLQPKDPVMLIFAERSLDTWISSGGKVDPKDPRKHALSDAVAYAGVYPKTKPASEEKIQMNFDSEGGVKIENEKGTFSFDKDGAFKSENEAGSVGFDKEGNFDVTNDGGNFGFSKTGKFATKQGAVDFITQLLLTIDKLVQTTKVMTAMGPQPFVPDPGYLAERAKLDPFAE